MIRFLRLWVVLLGIASFAVACGNDDSAGGTGDDGGGGDASLSDGSVHDARTDSTLPDTGVVDAAKDASDGGSDASKTYTVGGTVTGLSGSGLVLQDNAGDNLAISASGAFTFPKPLAPGAAYAVTVLTQPSAPSQTCTVASGTGTIGAANVTNVTIACTTQKYTIGGTISGLASGASVVLQNNAADPLTVSANGTFTFATPLASGTAYAVTVKTQPSSPVQTCTVSGGTGTVVAGNVSSIVVNCATNAFVVGGTIAGLAGTLVLQNNGGNDLTLTANGTFAFSTPLSSGATYGVSVKNQPSSPAQTCTIAGGVGTVASAPVTSIVVTCVTNKYTVGGSLSGLATGAKVVLADNGGDNLTLSANGAFTFATSVASGAAYAVTVVTQPSAPTQTCTLTSATGTVGAANVTSVAVSCTTTKFTVGGTLTGLAAGATIVLENNGADDLSLTQDGKFAFATSVASGASFSVTVKTQPTTPVQTCSVSGGSGAIGSGNVTGVVVNCATNAFIVGGTISGLEGTLVLQNNGGNDLSLNANGSFAFSSAVPSGGAYAVTVKTQPGAPVQVCTVTNGSGTVGSSDVTGVSITCATTAFAVGGTISGLAGGASVVLRDNAGDDLTVTQNGAFAFATPVLSGGAYAVTVYTQPTSPSQTCVVTAGTGTVGAGNVTSVAVACTTNTYTIGGTVSGLVGSGLVLQDNGGDNLTVSAGGVFTFATPVASNGAYAVTVLTQPSSPTQSCTVSAGSGTVTSGNVTSITVNCATNTYTVGGTIAGLSGTVVLQDNAADDLTLNAGSTTFAFATPVASGAPYSVTVKTQPGSPQQVCTVSAGGGTVAGSNVSSVSIACVTTTYTVGGSVSGLSAGTLVLRDNNGDDLSLTANGPFTFATAVASGSPYSVTVFTQPTNGLCTVTNGSGSVTTANITTVTVSCVVANGTTCASIKTAAPASADGVYVINPGGGTGFFSVYCDMTNDGGGWAKILQYNGAAYTPTINASGTIATATNTGFAKLSDAQINAIGGSGASKTYRLSGDKTTMNTYIATTNVWSDPARAMGLTAATFQACESLTLAGCTMQAVSYPTIDTLGWSISANDCTRYFTDYSNTPQCYNPGDNTKRCFGPGVSCNNHFRIDSFAIWMR